MTQDVRTWVDLREDRTPGAELASLNHNEPPIDVEALAEGRGIDIERVEMDLDAELHMNLQAGEARIVLAENTPPERSRFIIAHEIGHLMLHTFKTVHRDKTGEYDTGLEHRANAYAYELLMPAWMVRAYVQQNAKMDTETLVNQLAQIFEVPTAAMEFRLKGLELI